MSVTAPGRRRHDGGRLHARAVGGLAGVTDDATPMRVAAGLALATLVVLVVRAPQRAVAPTRSP